ncbi:hypothetical protein Mgra_00005138 [Meloidogyne graminicola]|nr:hypothetical protein Mgra_00005138 [Meloidogyne graminicola]
MKDSLIKSEYFYKENTGLFNRTHQLIEKLFISSQVGNNDLEASTSNFASLQPQDHTVALNSPSAPLSPPDSLHEIESSFDNEWVVLSPKNKLFKNLRISIPQKQSPRSILNLDKSSKSPQTIQKENSPISPLGHSLFETLNNFSVSKTFEQLPIERKKKYLRVKSFPPTKIINKILSSTKSPEPQRRIFDISDPSTYISSYNPPNNTKITKLKSNIENGRNSFKKYFSPTKKGKGKEIQKQEINIFNINSYKTPRTFSQSEIDEIKALVSPRLKQNYLN